MKKNIEKICVARRVNRRVQEAKVEPIEDPENGRKKAFSPSRILPLGIIAAAFVAFFAFGLDDYVNFATLRTHRETLTGFVQDRAFWSAIGFVALYTLAIAVSLPGGAVLTIAGGFLFGTLFATVYVVVGASMGATILFLAARTAVGESLRARTGSALDRMETGFRENAFSYLLFLRLIPVFPFWLVNLVPAFLNVPLKTYIVATVIGIIPGSFVYASVGNGLGALFDAGKSPDLGIIFAPDILIPLIGLAVLSLLPVAYKKFKGKGPGSGDSQSGEEGN